MTTDPHPSEQRVAAELGKLRLRIIKVMENREELSTNGQAIAIAMLATMHLQTLAEAASLLSNKDQ